MPAISTIGVRKAELLSTNSIVEAPFIKVDIGGHTFGIYEPNANVVNVTNGVVSPSGVQYPNYIQFMSIHKINGAVNTYKLNIKYPITENSDPNFFEKVFASVSDTRTITFSYGDAMQPNGITFKDEHALITEIQQTFDVKSCVISYTISAISTSGISSAANYNFPAVHAKPSDEIKRLVREHKYHILDIFPGMAGYEDLYIAGDDKAVDIPTHNNISPIAYLNKLVEFMTPASSSGTDLIKSNIYALSTEETELGAIFKVQKLQSASSVLSQLCVYDIDIGYPGSSVVTDFSVDENKNWSMFYHYNMENSNTQYATRIDSNGEVQYVYSPQTTNSGYLVRPDDSTWWTRMTQYPIKAKITLRGLIKPAMLMSYVKLNVNFFGHLHVASGYYVITSQDDQIGIGGYKTTLGLLRVGEAEELW